MVSLGQIWTPRAAGMLRGPLPSSIWLMRSGIDRNVQATLTGYRGTKPCDCPRPERYTGGLQCWGRAGAVWPTPMQSRNFE